MNHHAGHMPLLPALPPDTVKQIWSLRPDGSVDPLLDGRVVLVVHDSGKTSNLVETYGRVMPVYDNYHLNATIYLASKVGYPPTDFSTITGTHVDRDGLRYDFDAREKVKSGDHAYERVL